MKENFPAYKKISEHRYRETYGFYFDDFEVGDIFEHRPGRTITEADNILQSLICLNSHPLHIDNEYASQTEWGRTLVSSLVTLSIVGGMSLNSTSAKCSANLGWNKIRLTNPVFVGDTIYAETLILDKRLSKSRKTEGIVTVETKGIKRDKTVFMVYERSFMVPKREFSKIQENY